MEYNRYIIIWYFIYVSFILYIKLKQLHSVVKSERF